MYHTKDLEMLPAHMRYSVHRYIMYGEPVGDFLEAVFSNSLTGFFMRADSTNKAHVFEWAMFVYDKCPEQAQGSREKVYEWQQLGGLSAILKKAGCTEERIEEAFGLKQEGSCSPTTEPNGTTESSD